MFGDMAHIIYVNGENKSRTKLGRLMQDFHCTEAKDMKYGLLADRVRYFKETQKGRDEMCATVEDYARAIERGVNPKALQKLLGHASLQVTMDTYVHVTDDSMLFAVKQFESKTLEAVKEA